jgi:hypothetical protein
MMTIGYLFVMMMIQNEKEKKMRKSLLVVVSAMVFLTLVLAACGGGTTTAKPTVKSVTFAEKLNESYQAVNPKTQFKPTDVIYVSVDVSGRPKTGLLNGKFFYGDQLISEATVDFATVNSGVIVSIGEDTFAGFNLVGNQPWPVSKNYRFDVYLDGAKVGSYPYEVIA